MLEKACSIAADWAVFIKIDAKFEVQVGSFDSITTEAHTVLSETNDHRYGITIGNPDNTEFIIGISDSCPPELLEHVIIHELIHVWSFSKCGNNERENIEALTDQVAILVKHIRNLEQEGRLCPNNTYH